jgi:ComF family protein
MSWQGKRPTDGTRKGFTAAGILLDLLFPGRCLLCGAWLPPDGHTAPVCQECRDRLSPILGDRCAKCGMRLISERVSCTRCRHTDYSFESNRAVFPHSGPARELLARFKFEGRSRLAVLFADMAAREMDELRAALPIVPVPPRQGRRGPDAMELVARRLQGDHGRRVLRLLVRRGGAEQKSLDFIQRRDNLLGKIALRSPPGDAIPPCILLMDDVFTTGATLDACARTLRDAGCRVVYAMTLTIEE